MNEKLLKALEQYEKTFNDAFPTIPLLMGREENEVIEMIEKCIKARKDVYEMGFLSLDEDTEY